MAMDWKNLITDLCAMGWTQQTIAAHCKCGQTTISELQRGISNEPRYALGAKLKELYRAELRKTKRRQPA